MLLENIFENTPANLFRLEDRTNGSYQLVAPIFHDDGDMMTIFLEEDEDDNIRICDHGMSLMRLSYTFDVDTDRKRKILSDIILGKNAENQDGNLCLRVPRNNIYSGIMNYSNLVSRVCNLDILTRETVADLFYENLNLAIDDMFSQLNYKRNYKVPTHEDFQIDYAFLSEKKPIYLFGVKDTNKAQQTTITCLQLAKYRVPFKSIVVFENIDMLTKFARNNILNTVGKVFSDIEGFKEGGTEYIESELAA